MFIIPLKTSPKLSVTQIRTHMYKYHRRRSFYAALARYQENSEPSLVCLCVFLSFCVNEKQMKSRPRVILQGFICWTDWLTDWLGRSCHSWTLLNPLPHYMDGSQGTISHVHTQLQHSHTFKGLLNGSQQPSTKKWKPSWWRRPNHKKEKGKGNRRWQLRGRKKKVVEMEVGEVENEESRGGMERIPCLKLPACFLRSACRMVEWLLLLSLYMWTTKSSSRKSLAGEYSCI